MNTISAVVTILVAAITASGASLVASYFARPKTKAEARQTTVAAEVAMSAEAREWARDAMTRLESAERKADAAEQHADAAEKRANVAEKQALACERQMSRIEGRMGLLEQYVGTLRDDVIAGRRVPTPPPPNLTI